LSGLGSATASAAPAGRTLTDVSPAVQTPSRSVTLVTGDRLALSNDGQVTVQDNTSRRGISFVTYKKLGDVYAIPSDAAPMVASGQLDPELFDLTRLLAYGDTTQSGTTRLIVAYAPGATSAVRADITGPSRGGATITRTLTSARALAVRSAHRTATTFWHGLTTASGRFLKLRSGVQKVWLDDVLKPADATSTPQVGAPTAWAAGFDGTGETVAVVDSGIDATHPDLVGKVVAADNFTTEPNTFDNLGHGTHVASIIAGTGAASGGTQKGVAPGAKLINAKVCTAADSCDESAIIAGMQWAVQTEGAKIVNMSLGGPSSAGADDPLDQAVNNLTASNGALFVIAAGNSGPGYQTLGSPGDADSALTVGAVDSSDNIASFSSRGPRLGDEALKPDITAPGVGITGACSSTGTFCSPGQQYVQLSGTSMATPHVTGGAAIVLEAHPTWTPAQIKAALMGSAHPNPALDTFTQGAGRLDVGRGYAQSVLASPPSLSLGRQNGPRPNNPVLTPTITYANNATSAVTLTLSLTAHDPTGAAAPAGMFSLSATSVTVPAGGHGTVTLTANTTVSGPDGYYTGYVTATSGSIQVQTPFGDDQAAPTNTVTVNHIGRAGSAPIEFVTLFFTTDGSNVYFFVGGGGQQSATQGLPSGNYLVYSTIYDVDAQGRLQTSVLTYPDLNLTASQTLTVDARTASQVSITVPDSKAAPFSTEVSAQFVPSTGGYISVSGLISSGTAYTAQLGPANTYVYGFTSKIVASMFDPGPNGDERDSPHTYMLGWFFSQYMPTGLTENETAGSLATVQASQGAQETGDVGYKGAVAESAQPPLFLSDALINLPMDVPLSRTESYNTDNNVRWYSGFEEQDGTGTDIVDTVSSLTGYTGGSNYQQTWNRPVTGPSFTSTVSPVNWVVRRGNTIFPDVPLTGDGAGHAGHPGGATVSQGLITLKQNGTVVGTEPYPSSQVRGFNVPAAWSTYELDASVQRTSSITLSTSITAAWTFTSASVDPNSFLPLQLWAVTFSPSLSASNTAPAGASFQIPVTVAAQPGSAVSGVQSVTVDYSTNDGTSWQPATVSTASGGYVATVAHPNITGFVSLRASARDYAGNAVSETIIRAYKIAPGG